MRKIVHQNLAVILWQCNYNRNTFIVLVPEWLDSEVQGFALKDAVANLIGYSIMTLESFY